MSLIWNGDAVKRKVIAAAQGGIDETMARCVVEAKKDYYEGHGLRFAVLQGSVKMQPAEVRGDRVVGQWGSFDVNYARHVEQGTGRMTGQGQLQGAADAEYPQLAERIRARMR